MPELILASSSPRRQNFMKELGVPFSISTPDVDETPLKSETPTAYVKRVTACKATVIAEKNAGKVVLAADTTVVVGRKILGKPENMKEAAAMLRLMSGKRHKVFTCVCVVTEKGEILEKLVTTTVKFKPLTPQEIERHIANEKNWQGKAGGYGIQSTQANLMIQWMRGSFTGVVGLPILETVNLLKRAHINV